MDIEIFLPSPRSSVAEPSEGVDGESPLEDACQR
jgi:hypothetical protein